jgi:class 3 adenylate cyclase
MRYEKSAQPCSDGLLAELKASVPLFCGVDQALWSAVSTAFRTQFFRSGELICAKGDEADALLVVWRGAVEVSRDDIYLAVRGAREVVGELALIEETSRGATLSAKGLVQVIAVPAEAVDRLLDDKRFARNLLRIVSRKLNDATDQRAFRFAVEELLFTEFKAHVSRPVLDELLSQHSAYGSPRTIDGVVLFADVREFSVRSAQLAPLQVALELGRFLDHAVDVIHHRGGLVDKFVGDAVMAVWGWPHATPTDSVSEALVCACELAISAPAFCLGGMPLSIGVGLSVGPMFMGNVGSGDKRQFTVLGDAVNRAARHESATKGLGAPIVLGQSFFERLDATYQSRAEAHPNHPLRGVEPQTIYAITTTSAGLIAGRK